MEWKWTKGEPYERSRRQKHVEEYENKKFSKEMESSAYTTSLNHDENTWDILNQTHAGSGFKVSNKREELDSKISNQIEIEVKYSGYIARQNQEISKLKKNENIKIPEGLNYEKIQGLSNEVRQKLIKTKPETLAQASRISGVTPAALSLLLVHLKRQQLVDKTSLAV